MADAASIMALRRCMERWVEGSTGPRDFMAEAASTVVGSMAVVDSTVVVDADKSALAS
jgi:hypothetical protein